MTISTILQRVQSLDPSETVKGILEYTRLKSFRKGYKKISPAKPNFVINEDSRPGVMIRPSFFETREPPLNRPSTKLSEDQDTLLDTWTTPFDYQEEVPFLSRRSTYSWTVSYPGVIYHHRNSGINVQLSKKKRERDNRKKMFHFVKDQSTVIFGY